MVDARVTRFEEFKDFRSEISQAKLKLDEVEAVERAKGLLMSQRGMDEDAAYNMLRAMAAKKNMKLVDLSNQFVEVAKLLIV
jgi:two-component system, response regulator / RNA-binding antiterminator